MQNFNSHYWNERYSKNETGWDLGVISTPLKSYIDQIENKSLRILIPGAGNCHEAEYLWCLGFKNISIIDLASKPLVEFRNRLPEFPVEQTILGNFFDLNETYDLILEQTFFCALSPSQRTSYVTKCSELLNVKGKLAGVLFNFELTEIGPPFGGSESEYQRLFSSYFDINTLEVCYNSEPSRKNKELFFIFEKK